MLEHKVLSKERGHVLSIRFEFEAPVMHGPGELEGWAQEIMVAIVPPNTIPVAAVGMLEVHLLFKPAREGYQWWLGDATMTWYDEPKEERNAHLN